MTRPIPSTPILSTHAVRVPSGSAWSSLRARLPSGRDRMSACDPVTLEIIRGAIRAGQAEMEALLERTAISAFIREKKDFYTALFDAEGVMAVGSNVPIFGDICGPVFDHFPKETMREGD